MSSARKYSEETRVRIHLKEKQISDSYQEFTKFNLVSHSFQFCFDVLLVDFLLLPFETWCIERVLFHYFLHESVESPSTRIFRIQVDLVCRLGNLFDSLRREILTSSVKDMSKPYLFIRLACCITKLNYGYLRILTNYFWVIAFICILTGSRPSSYGIRSVGFA